MTYNMLGNSSILGMSTTDYYMMGRRQKITKYLKSLLHLANCQHNCAVMQDSRS